MSTPNIGSSASYRKTSALKVVAVLVALKATVDRNDNSHCWQDSGSSESCITAWRRWRTHRKGTPLMWRTHMWGRIVQLLVKRTHKWWKCKLRIALKATVVWQLTKNKSTLIIHNVQLRLVLNHYSLQPVNHCVESVHIRSFFWSVFSCIQTEYRKIRTGKNSVFWYFSRSKPVNL